MQCTAGVCVCVCVCVCERERESTRARVCACVWLAVRLSMYARAIGREDEQTKNKTKNVTGGGWGVGGKKRGASYSKQYHVRHIASMHDEAGWGDDTEIHSSPGTNVNYA